MVPPFDWIYLPSVVEMCLKLRGLENMKVIAEECGLEYQAVRSVFKKQQDNPENATGIIGAKLIHIMRHYNIRFEELERVWNVMAYYPFP